MGQTTAPDLILINGKFTTLDRSNPAPPGGGDHRTAASPPSATRQTVMALPGTADEGDRSRAADA